ncbi:MAG: lysine 2,3-aminomutase [Planctomycetota bacterium]|nr:lysine 2,3-aminomutase [Planctomycetota bacterium]
MQTPSTMDPNKFRVFTARDLHRIPQLTKFSSDEILAMRAVAQVLPFRVNNYVVDQLIDWDQVPNDPIYQLTFPQPGMLENEKLEQMMQLLRDEAPADEIKTVAQSIQRGMNPHPAGQMELNVPRMDGVQLAGLQHKYRETVLFFPSSGQTCHSYCTYCFRWPQFVGLDEMKFAARETDSLVTYLKQHKEVSSVLFTGGDPMVMKTKVLRRYIEPLLEPELEHIQSIRIGTKAVAYWPQRFTTDADADDLLDLFETVRKKGRHLAIMGHYSHPRELEPEIAQQAVRRIQSTGAVVRCQAPLIRHVNDDPRAWAELWQKQVALGAIPYYMFVERDTGPRGYFEVPLVKAFEIFSSAYRRVSGLGRTVRGPSMSSMPGKVLVDGVTEIHGERALALKFLQAREPAWNNRVFFAKYDEKATWLDDLEPAFGERRWFWQTAPGQQNGSSDSGDRMQRHKRAASVGNRQIRLTGP